MKPHLITIIHIENVGFSINTNSNRNLELVNPCLIEVFINTKSINDGEIISAFDSALRSFGQYFENIKNIKNETYLKVIKEHVDNRYHDYIDYFAEFTVNDVLSIIELIQKNAPTNLMTAGFNFTFLLSASSMQY